MRYRRAMPEPFDLAARMVDEIVANKPTLATLLGVKGYDHLWDDLSPQGHQSRLDLARRQRQEMAPHLVHVDRWQRHAARVIVDFLDEYLSAFERHEHLRQLRHTAGDFDDLRDTFDRMDTASEAGWTNVVTRLETFGEPLTGLRDSLEEGRLNGLAVARRQVLSVIDQAKHLTGPASKWRGLVRKAEGGPGSSIGPRLSAAVTTAQAAVAEFVQYLETIYLPAAPVADAVGRDRYVA